MDSLSSSTNQQKYTVRGMSLYNSVPDGSEILVDLCISSIKLNDYVLFHYKDMTVIKRVLLVPGSPFPREDFKGTVLYDFAVEYNDVVPPDVFIVEGDFRGCADSFLFGPINRSVIVGRVV